jgi:hypothetical protein
MPWAPVAGHRRPVTTYLPETLAAVDAEPAAGAAGFDLAANQPGQAVRRQAELVRQAAPVRSLLARMLLVPSDERAWRIGADGEEKVGRSLAKLTRRDGAWRVLHSIPVGDRGSDIDHVVIGPGGVFTLNTKNHPGATIWVGEYTFLVNGFRQPYLRNSRHEAARASRLLSAACGFPIDVAGVVVPVNAEKIVIKKAPVGAHVMNRRRLARWLRRLPATLDAATVDAIYDAARRSTTWQPA